MALRDIIQHSEKEALKNPEQFCKEAIIHQLENPSEIILNDEGEMLWIVDNKLYNNFVIGGGQVFLSAPPVLMAVVMKRYDLVKRLIEENNYKIATRGEGWVVDLIGSLKSDSGFYIEKVCLGKFIMADNDMPDELRIYLIQKVFKEKKEFEKKTNCKNFSLFNFADYRVVNNPFERETFTNPNMDEKVFFRVLKIIADKEPEILNEIIDNEIAKVFQESDIEFQKKLLHMLLTEVVETDSQKINIIQMPECSYDLGSSNDSLWQIPFIYKDEAKYYRENDKLRHGFFSGVFGNLIKCILQRRNTLEYLYKKESLESLENLISESILKLLRKFLPKDFTLERSLLKVAVMREVYLTNRTMSEFTEFHVFGMDLELAFGLYKMLTRKSVILDDSIVLKTEKGIELEIESTRNKFIIRDNDTDWIRMVEKFSYEDSKPINEIQKYILSNCGIDMLIFTIKRGLLQGKHIEAAIKYCMKYKTLQRNIPGIIAFLE